jgi:putative membrane protein
MIMQYNPHGPYHGYGWYSYGWVYAVIGAIILLAILYLVFRRPETQEKRDDKALGILKERYAKGEITKEEFEEMKKNIKK